MKRRTCELCGAPAAVHCDSDAAFLCWTCDATVHEANFLVARHARQIICSACGQLDHDHPFSGVGLHFPRPICSSCESDVDNSSSSCSSSSSSSCISTADKNEIATAIPLRRRRDSAEEGILVKRWCRSIGVENETTVGVAMSALRLGRRKMRSVSFRTCAAAAAWFALKRHGPIACPSSTRLLKRLEACCGVPAKHILVAESHLSLALRGGGHRQVEEDSWEDSSSSS